MKGAKNPYARLHDFEKNRIRTCDREYLTDLQSAALNHSATFSST